RGHGHGDQAAHVAPRRGRHEAPHAPRPRGDEGNGHPGDRGRDGAPAHQGTSEEGEALEGETPPAARERDRGPDWPITRTLGGKSNGEEEDSTETPSEG